MGVNQFLVVVLSSTSMPQVTVPKIVTRKSAALIGNMLINHYEYKFISSKL